MRRLSTEKHRQHGAIAIIVGISIAVLIGLAGLAIDLGHMYIAKTEMQNAMDACALAAARELDKQSDALVRAERAAITVGTRNNVDFQRTAVTISPANVTFSANLSPNSAYLSRAAGADPTKASYAMCTASQPGIALYLMGVMGFGQQTVSATAVASLGPSQGTCAIPLTLCDKSASPPASCPGGGAPDSHGLCPTVWYPGKFQSGGGNWNWIQYPNQPSGEPGVAQYITGAGYCDLSINTVTTSPGNMGNALGKAWNSRFGLYQGGGNNPNLTTAPPDFTGYPYTATNFPAQRNALPDFLSKRTGFASYGNQTDTIKSGNTISGLSVSNAYTVSTHGTNGQLATYGSDRRIVVMPITSCSGGTMPVEAWACGLMLNPYDAPTSTLNIEYLGMASTPSSPCGSFGTPGSGAGPKVPTLVQ